jgi:coenzyme Q-binding protein COQ10
VIERMGATLPFSCEQVFDMAADIERYPDFLDWWVAAKILQRDANGVTVTQTVGAGPIRLTFESRATLLRPCRIDVTSNDAIFKRYRFAWIVSPMPSSSCAISVTADCELESFILQRVFERLLPGSLDDTVAAFGARAHALYAADRHGA